MEFEEVSIPAGVDDEGTTNATLWGDFNNDGWLDLVTGNYLQANRLYLNQGDGTFEDVTDEWNVGNAGPCRSLHAADFDQDGWLGPLCGQHQQPQCHAQEHRRRWFFEPDLPHRDNRYWNWHGGFVL